MKKILVLAVLVLLILPFSIGAQEEDPMLKSLREAQRKINERLDSLDENFLENKSSYLKLEEKTEDNALGFEMSERRGLEKELEKLKDDFNNYKVEQIEKRNDEKNEWDLNMYHALLLAFLAMNAIVYFYIGKSYKEVRENAENLVSQEISKITKIYRNNVDELNERVSDYKDLLADKIKLWSEKIGGMERKIEDHSEDIVNNKRITQYFSEALELSKQNKHKEAVDLWDKIIRIDPEGSIAYNNKAVSLLSLNQNEDALNNARKASRLDSGYTLAWYNKACAYAKMGNGRSAVRNLKKAIDLDKDAKDDAKKDIDFDKVRDLKEFKELMGDWQ